MVSDPKQNTVWMFTAERLYEVEVENETRDIWKLYLEREDFENALAHCSNPMQTEQVGFFIVPVCCVYNCMPLYLYVLRNISLFEKVMNVQADKFFQTGQYELAARWVFCEWYLLF